MAHNVLMKQLLEAGVHFGHQTNRWNPKMEPYIFGQRNGIYIVDLAKTADHLIAACDFLRNVADQGGYVLFVGTKRQAQEVIREEAQKSDMFYVTERWLGGMLTNFSTIKKSINRMVELETMRDDGTFKKLSKKEVAQKTREITKLNKNLNGIRGMSKLPGAVFVVDSKNEDIAVKEANKLEIPVVALVDTNCDPDMIDIVIPGNDDAIRAIKLVTGMVGEAVREGNQKFIKGGTGKKPDKEELPSEDSE